MFYTGEKADRREYYIKMLKVAGSLSNLFTDKAEPYLAYRLVENLFCKSFGANNLSRHDTSIDASKNHVGVGIKTFLHKNGQSFEKIAEFNRELDLFKGLSEKEKISKVATLRNERISFAKRTYGLTDMLYHCVTRSKGAIHIFEEPMQMVNISEIKDVRINRNTIRFTDGVGCYAFNISKSTLFKQFFADSILDNIAVKIISDPFSAIEKLMIENIRTLTFSEIRSLPHVFLPLYSTDKKTGEKYVAEKSSLNQWNAGGRQRDMSEVYIQIPAWIHDRFKNFFPSRDTKFSLILPNGQLLSTKVCQDNGKALMSDPNLDLGKWILRDVLNLSEGELLKYDKLESLGLDSVVIYKHDEKKYSIDFSRIGTYEEFMNKADSLIAEDTEGSDNI